MKLSRDIRRRHHDSEGLYLKKQKEDADATRFSFLVSVGESENL